MLYENKNKNFTDSMTILTPKYHEKFNMWQLFIKKGSLAYRAVSYSP